MQNSDMNAETRTAIVTGASSGIGLAFARVLAAEGYALMLVARDEARLTRVAAQLAGEHRVTTTVVAADLANSEGAAQVASKATSLGISPEVLINSAGKGVYGPFIETPLESELEMLRVNVVGLTELTKRIVPSMVAQHRGRILNLASTAAFVPGPLMSVYYATKAYVLSFSEGLASELEGTGVTVTALCPPPTQSGFQAAARMESSRLVKGKNLLSTEEVAKAGYDGMLAGRRIVIPGFGNWLSVQMVPFVPRKMLGSYVRTIQSRAQS